MCRFADSNSTDSKTVLAALSRYTREAQATIGPRWINARKLLATQRSIEASELIGFDAYNDNAPFICVSPKLHQNPQESKCRNKHLHVPHNVSSIFTGRKAVHQMLHKKLLKPIQPDSSPRQKRFVIYGLGGSGKTQFCLKFVQDNRDRYAKHPFLRGSVYTKFDLTRLTLASVSGGYSGLMPAVKKTLKGPSHRSAGSGG